MEEEIATLGFIPTDESCAGPILTTMSQNIPNRLESLSFNLLKKRDNYGMSASLTPTLDLVGKQIKRANNSQYLVGFYNSEKNSVRFVATTAVLNLDTHVKNQLESGAKKFDQDASYMEKKAMIIEEIGTKKSQKILKQLKNKIISESKIQSADQIKQIMKLQGSMIKGDFENEHLEEFQTEWNRKRSFLPEFNLSAKSAGKIYNHKSIISEDDYAELYISELFKQGIAIPYVKECIGKLGFWRQKNEDGTFEEQQELPEAEKKSADAKKKQLLYLNYMMKMQRLKKISTDLSEISEQLKMPLNIIQGFIDRFYETQKTTDGSEGIGGGVKYSKTKALDIKMICYILILNLIISDYKVNLKDLMSVLKIDEQKAVLIATEVGCTIIREGDNVWAKLRKLKVGDTQPVKKNAKNNEQAGS